MPEVTEKYVRIRVVNPSKFQKESFRTIELTSGIKAIIGRPKGKTKTEVQSLLFSKKTWDMGRAMSWAREHGYKPTASYEPKTATELEFNAEVKLFSAIDKIDVLKAEKDQPKKVIITGRLMNTEVNGNSWNVSSNVNEAIAKEILGSPVKMMHKEDDYEVIGTGIEGTTDGHQVYYKNEITEPKAIEKFESGTWNVRNMGISPSLRPTIAICSICGTNVMEKFCGHKIRKIYDGKKAEYTIQEAHLIEQSLTSDAAYKHVGSGTIDTVSFVASLDNSIKEVKKMGENTELFAQIAKKDSEIDVLRAQVEDTEKAKEEVETKVTETEKKVEETEAAKADSEKATEEAKKETETVKAELEETKGRLGKFVAEQRTAELSKRLKDEDLVAEIVKKDMTDEDFTAELVRIDKIQAGTKSNADAGSIPTGDAKTKKDEFAASWGTDQDAYIKSMVEGRIE